MRLGNRIVAAVLRSPLHRVASKALAVVRYSGRRSGRQFATPVQYAERGNEVIILVGRPQSKTWWRNFAHDHELDVLIGGRWRPMTARAIVGAEEPDTVIPLVDAYLARFPKAARSLSGDTASARAQQAVVVWCRPR